MEITENIFKNWLKCKYKAFLKISGQAGTKSDYENMLRERRSEFKAEAVSKYFHTPNMRAIIPTIFDATTAIHIDPQKTYIDVEIRKN